MHQHEMFRRPNPRLRRLEGESHLKINAALLSLEIDIVLAEAGIDSDRKSVFDIDLIGLSEVHTTMCPGSIVDGNVEVDVFIVVVFVCDQIFPSLVNLHHAGTLLQTV